jgi:hypothetical protein
MQYPNEIIQLGGIANQIVSTRENPQRYRVYDPQGIAPALNCAQGDGLNPYIIVRDCNENTNNK